MSPPAKKYLQLSGCMTCNTKLTVLNPGPRPAFNAADAATHAGQGNARGSQRCQAAWLLFLDVLRARTFLQPALMTSSNFICVRSSVSTKSPRTDVKAPPGVRYLRSIPVYGTLPEHELYVNAKNCAK